MIFKTSAKRRWGFFVAIALLLGSCRPAEPPAEINSVEADTPVAVAPDNSALTAGLPRLDGKATVEITTSNKAITVELDGDKAPYTAGNFVDLAQKGVYDSTIFHRVIDGFVAQGGDPQSTDPQLPISRLGSGNYIDEATGQARTIPLEILPEGADEPVYGKTFKDMGISEPPALTHDKGAIAMARSTVNSASAQFYITLEDTPFLNGDYAVFGQVTDGMDVVDNILLGDVIESVKVTSGTENLVQPEASPPAE